jgi:hypothetical protein
MCALCAECRALACGVAETGDRFSDADRMGVKAPKSKDDLFYYGVITNAVELLLNGNKNALLETMKNCIMYLLKDLKSAKNKFSDAFYGRVCEWIVINSLLTGFYRGSDTLWFLIPKTTVTDAVPKIKEISKLWLGNQVKELKLYWVDQTAKENSYSECFGGPYRDAWGYENVRAYYSKTADIYIEALTKQLERHRVGDEVYDGE